MSTATTTTTTRQRRFFGSAAGTALAAAVVIGGMTALGLALPDHASVQPVAPTSQCTIESCHAGDHPLLPGRHDFQLRPGGGYVPPTGGGHVVLGQP
jgi:hypothetical protein